MLSLMSNDKGRCLTSYYSFALTAAKDSAKDASWRTLVLTKGIFYSALGPTRYLTGPRNLVPNIILWGVLLVTS